MRFIKEEIADPKSKEKRRFLFAFGKDIAMVLSLFKKSKQKKGKYAKG